MQPNFSIVLNSTVYMSRTNRSSIQYGFDWSFLPEGKYSVSWKFTSQASTANQLLILSIPDLGVRMNSYSAGSSTTAYTNSYMGTISNWYIGNAAGMFRADYGDNPPLRFEQKPTNNVFNVNLYDNTGTAYDIGVDYILILNFQRIDE
jgi:hypothetical protein